jgi:hypothetical protein
MPSNVHGGTTPEVWGNNLAGCKYMEVWGSNPAFSDTPSLKKNRWCEDETALITVLKAKRHNHLNRKPLVL